MSGTLMSNPQGKNNALLELLAAHGVRPKHVDAMLRDPKKAALASRAFIDAAGLSTPVEEAKSIMGHSFFAPLTDRFDRDVPFPHDVLVASKGTHMLFWGNGKTVAQMASEHPRCFEENELNPSFPLEALFTAPLEERWHLVSMKPLPETRGKRFLGQQKCKPENCSYASARQIVWMLILLSKRDRDAMYRLVSGGECIATHDFSYPDGDLNDRVLIQVDAGDHGGPTIDFTIGAPDSGLLVSVNPYV